MRSNTDEEVYGSIPVLTLSQFVPATVSVSCDVCCRFPEQDSFLRPYFAWEEVEHAIKQIADSASLGAFQAGESFLSICASLHGHYRLLTCPWFDPTV